MHRRLFFTVLVLILAIAMIRPLIGWAAPARQGPETPVSGMYRGVSTAVQFDVSPPLSSIAPLTPQESKPFEIPKRGAELEGALGPQDADAALQTTFGPSHIPAPSVSFNGPDNISWVSPPDPVGDVGPNHYVAMSNLSFQIFDKAGNSLYGPAFNNTLWAGFGGGCETRNNGNPIVLYDQLADRWLLTQFAVTGSGYYNCVAISTSGDPTGTYYRYAFSTGGNFPADPKYGIWPDAYYMSTVEYNSAFTFEGVGAYALNRAQMLAGNPTPEVISFLIPPGATPYTIGDGLLPADFDGFTLPPAGSPNYFVGSMDDGGPYGAPQDALTLWKFHVDFATPANSTFVLANTIPIASYDTIFPCSPTSRNCIPQPDTTNKVDILSYRQRPMHRLAYRNFGTHESLVTNQSVEAATAMAGIRWWEVRSPNSSPVLYQDSTYAPGVTDMIHRWMGSIAQDSAGNMALGYSASNGTSTYPSSWYTGRLASDPLNTMPQGEGSIINGTGSQTGSQRWGDYTSMNVDPVDDCTFWYVNQWVPTTSSVGWQLRIGAFKFNECGTTDFTLTTTPNSQTICAGSNASYNVVIGSVNGYANPVTLSASGNPGTASFDTNPVTPSGSSTMTISGAAAGVYNFSVIGTAAGPNVHQVPVGLTVTAAAPGAPTLTAPANGATNEAATPTFTWNAVADASSYSIQVATDAGFTNVVASATGLANPTWTSNATLNTSTMYYWRVLASNACGVGNYSSVFTFTTVAVPPNINASPLSMSATLAANMIVQQTLTIANTGGGTLNWQIAEEPADLSQMANLRLPSLPGVACDSPADVGWVSVSPANGSNAASTNTPVTVAIDSTGLAEGIYNANLCVASNDPDTGPGNGTGLVVVPVQLVVGQSCISGRVFANDTSHPMPDAYVQACGSSGSCRFTQTDGSGQYSVCSLVSGEYNIAAFPSPSWNVQPAALGPVTVLANTTLDNQDLILVGPMPLPFGTTITNIGIGGNGLPVVYWATDLTLTTQGCAGGTASYQVMQNGSVVPSGTMGEGPSGVYTGVIPPLYPLHGYATVTITLTCPSGGVTTSSFDIYIDPSGHVLTTTGVPIAGATVTLYRADAPGGPFAVVPDGSGMMAPENRTNPDTTDAAGRFGWNVLAGYYIVRAETTGCHAPGNPGQAYVESPVLTIPPPVTDLELRLECPALAVTLAEFAAYPGDGTVQIAWETVAETDLQGFHLWRSLSPSGPTERLTQAMIPAQAPGSSQGASYRYDDATIQAGQTTWYWLEDVDLSGATTLHGPVSATVDAPTAVSLAKLGATSVSPAMPAVPPLVGVASVFVAVLAGFGLVLRRVR